MKKLLTLLFTLSLINFSFSQSNLGRLKGKITDKATGKILLFVNLSLIQNEKVVTGASSNLDGEYLVSNLKPGIYKLQTSLVGYKKYQIKEVQINPNKTTFIDVELLAAEVNLIECWVGDTTSKIDIHTGITNGGTLTKEELAAMPKRNTRGNLKIRGCHSQNLYYYVDGIKVYDSTNLYDYKTNTQEITVITGGLPGTFGYFTGGPIHIDTKEGFVKPTVIIGALRIEIKDKTTGETLPFVCLKLIQNKKAIALDTSDLEGEFLFSNIDPGVYTLEVIFVGYNKYRMNNILIKNNKLTFVNIELETASLELEDYTIINYTAPAIEKCGNRKMKII